MMVDNKTGVQVMAEERQVFAYVVCVNRGKAFWVDSLPTSQAKWKSTPPKGHAGSRSVYWFSPFYPSSRTLVSHERAPTGPVCSSWLTGPRLLGCRC
jgi:hypothetical protein